MVVSILGCGWYGKALALALIENGYIVKGSSTSPEKLKQLSAEDIIAYNVKFDADNESFNPGFFKCDVLVVSVPPKFRSGETAGYIPKIKRIIEAIIKYQISRVIYISSTGVYGDHNKGVDESDDPLPDSESGRILLQAEKLFQKEAEFRTTVIRFGGLIGPGRDPGRFFAGKTVIPNGMAPVNLIHQQDCIGVSLSILEKDAFGYSINACSPDHPAKGAFYYKAAEKSGLPLPEFIDELRNWKLINSIYLTTILNYEFKVSLL